MSLPQMIWPAKLLLYSSPARMVRTTLVPQTIPEFRQPGVDERVCLLSFGREMHTPHTQGIKEPPNS